MYFDHGNCRTVINYGLKIIVYSTMWSEAVVKHKIKNLFKVLASLFLSLCGSVDVSRYFP